MPPLVTYLHRIDANTDSLVLPRVLNDPFVNTVHPIAALAADQLQQYIETIDWGHNFGTGQAVDKPKAKMFGVLVVRDNHDKLGFLAAFSGKIGGQNHFPGFVPPVYDGLREDGFLNTGMIELSHINEKISLLINDLTQDNSMEISRLKQVRRDHSNSLQGRIFDSYQFLNIHGTTKSLREIFEDTYHSNPPGGAGECAAPKLLQHAFQNNMTPLAIAEFFWGRSPKAKNWKHKSFYPACEHKCAPILKHMLKGIKLESSSESN